jgi:hypothetical protein
MTDHHDEIDFEPPTYSVCECCGATTTRLTRFVSREGSAFAVYFANFSDGPHDHVSVLVGFGDWAEEAPAHRRTAIAFRIWTLGDSFQVGLVDPEEDGWETDFLGRKLSREEALASDLKAEAFALSDHMVICDRPVIEFLEARAGMAQ